MFFQGTCLWRRWQLSACCSGCFARSTGPLKFTTSRRNFARLKCLHDPRQTSANSSNFICDAMDSCLFVYWLLIVASLWQPKLWLDSGKITDLSEELFQRIRLLGPSSVKTLRPSARIWTWRKKSKSFDSLDKYACSRPNVKGRLPRFTFNFRVQPIFVIFHVSMGIRLRLELNLLFISKRVANALALQLMFRPFTIDSTSFSGVIHAYLINWLSTSNQVQHLTDVLAGFDECVNHWCKLNADWPKSIISNNCSSQF